jgi:hypothetical protein
MTIIQWKIDKNFLRDSRYKRLQIEYNNRPIRDANSKIVYYVIRSKNEVLCAEASSHPSAAKAPKAYKTIFPQITYTYYFFFNRS